MANAEDSDESSTDEDFNPDDADPEAKTGGDEEFDSDAADRSTDSEDRGVSIFPIINHPKHGRLS